MNTLIPTSRCNFCNIQIFNSYAIFPKNLSAIRRTHSLRANSNDLQTQAVEGPKEEEEEQHGAAAEPQPQSMASTAPALDKDLKKVVQKTAATFAPRASTASKNPAVPGTTLYTVFEVQGYASMLLAIPSLRARDCSKNEKEALNYLFLLIPLLNVTIPFFWKSFAAVWSADTVAFFGMYAWKMGWLQRTD
ncbi:uncharacterized protein LOC111018412 isoform X2 [Momordica charantia]|uniref:Uncharacterized protein LOC111018412 isoform X2 n=1 Tax=Momordica charantia TaxID=3673 RepID=A0A6J1D9Z9_MOMCH|nr:uncharacterized protein LOC111018412 isoform X2 [Momordica charantia]